MLSMKHVCAIAMWTIPRMSVSKDGSRQYVLYVNARMYSRRAFVKNSVDLAHESSQPRFSIIQPTRLFGAHVASPGSRAPRKSSDTHTHIHAHKYTHMHRSHEKQLQLRHSGLHADTHAIIPNVTMHALTYECPHLRTRADQSQP
jgi:hypothetical protein